MPYGNLAVHAHLLISVALGSVGLPLKSNDPIGFRHSHSAQCSIAVT